MQTVICATPEHWRYLEAWCERPEYLLPGVGCPAFAPMSRRHTFTTAEGRVVRSLSSEKTDISKTPSMVTDAGYVRGITHWADDDYGSTPAQRAAWSANPAHNILIRCAHVNALDIDVPDIELAEEIERIFCDALGVATLPRRTRPNTGKRTLFWAYAVEHHQAKRALTLSPGADGEKQAIEFLGTKQQSVLAGFHSKSGTHYIHQNWEALKRFSVELVARAWDALRMRFPDNPASRMIVAGEIIRNYGSRVQRTATPDPVADYIEQTGAVLSYANNGALNVPCPWEAGHSSDTGENATSWIPAWVGTTGTGGWSCLHESCNHRTSHDYMAAIGYTAHAVATAFASSTVAPPKPKVNGRWDLIKATVAHQDPNIDLVLRRTPKGVALKEYANLCAILRSGDIVEFRHDSFMGKTEMRFSTETAFELLGDALVGQTREIIQRRHELEYSAAEVNAAIVQVSSEFSYDSAQAWLTQQTWDGVPRIELFAKDVLCSPDSQYTRAFSVYLWVSQVGRVVQPGVKADMSAVLVSPRQGTGKSSTVRAMSPFNEWHGELNLSGERDSDTSRLMLGKTTIELGELRGLASRDAESIKAFMSRQSEEWVPKYREHAVSYPRRSIFIGTSNQTRFLSDPTGNRRWLPVRVAVTSNTGHIAWPAFREKVEQYWAEARDLIAKFASAQDAVEHYAAIVNGLAEPARRAATVADEKLDELKRWLGGQAPGAVVNVGAVRSALVMHGPRDHLRIAAMMQSDTEWVEVSEPYTWRKPDTSQWVL